jgi:hypothetical protein
MLLLLLEIDNFKQRIEGQNLQYLKKGTASAVSFNSFILG